MHYITLFLKQMGLSSWLSFPGDLFHSSSSKPAEKATMGLARVGSRAALSFAFAFLRRAWRSGEDADLCSELLQESLDALQSLPEATLFDEGCVSSVWLEVVERATKFLHSVVAGWALALREEIVVGRVWKGTVGTGQTVGSFEKALLMIKVMQ